MEIPATADQIDAAWLSEALQERHPGARVRGVEVFEKREVTNSHAWLSVDYDEPAGAPPTMFCKLLPNDPARRDAIAASGMGLKEARFYARLAPTIHMRVPAVHVARHKSADGTFVLLMEDLGATGCTVSSGPESVSPDAAATALEDLAELHVRFEDPARRQAEAPWVPEPGAATDYGTTRLRYGLDHHRDRLTDAFAEMSELYIEQTPALHALWHGEPKTVIHGDTHIGNLFDDHGRTGFLDWGIIALSTPLRDASYFLQMSLSVDDRRKHETELLRHYLDARRARGGIAIDFDRAWTTYRVQAGYLAPASCQVVTFPEDASERRKVFANAFLERAQAAIEDLEARAAIRESAGV